MIESKAMISSNDIVNLLSCGEDFDWPEFFADNYRTHLPSQEVKTFHCNKFHFGRLRCSVEILIQYLWCIYMYALTDRQTDRQRLTLMTAVLIKILLLFTMVNRHSGLMIFPKVRFTCPSGNRSICFLSSASKPTSRLAGTSSKFPSFRGTNPV